MSLGIDETRNSSLKRLLRVKANRFIKRTRKSKPVYQTYQEKQTGLSNAPGKANRFIKRTRKNKPVYQTHEEKQSMSKAPIPEEINTAETSILEKKASPHRKWTL